MHHEQFDNFMRNVFKHFYTQLAKLKGPYIKNEKWQKTLENPDSPVIDTLNNEFTVIAFKDIPEQNFTAADGSEAKTKAKTVHGICKSKKRQLRDSAIQVYYNDELIDVNLKKKLKKEGEERLSFTNLSNLLKKEYNSTILDEECIDLITKPYEQ